MRQICRFKRFLCGLLFLIFIPTSALAWNVIINNNTGKTVYFYLNCIDHNFKDYSRPFNTSGGEISADCKTWTILNMSGWKGRHFLDYRRIDESNYSRIRFIVTPKFEKLIVNINTKSSNYKIIGE